MQYGCICICLCRIAKLDRRIGTCTVLASNKWQPIFTECETALGFTGDATNDSFAAWSRLASNSVKKSKKFSIQSRRANSLDSTSRRTVRVPVELIPLERARTMTTIDNTNGAQVRLELSLACSTRVISKHLSLSNSALHTSPPTSSMSLQHNISSSLEILDISQPLHLDKSLSCSPQRNNLAVPTQNISPYAPQADTSPCSSTSSDKERPHSAPEDEVSMQVEEVVQKSPDTKAEIQKYLDQVCCVISHFIIVPG